MYSNSTFNRFYVVESNKKYTKSQSHEKMEEVNEQVSISGQILTSMLSSK
jgi:hypothetical protein